MFAGRSLIAVGVALMQAPLVPPAVCQADELANPDFRVAPYVTREGSRIWISFSLTEAADVAVEIRRGTRVVRHLAAGVLGPNPPEPLRPGLAQRLPWDGTDDLGRPVKLSECSVYLGVGLRPRFDRILGWRGEAVGGPRIHCGGVAGLAVDERSRCYVLYSGSKKPTSVHVFTREGRYLRTIMPYPASLAYEKVRNLGLIRLSDGRFFPMIRHPIMFALYPESYGSGGGLKGLPAQTMVLAGRGLVMVNSWQSRYGLRYGGLGPRRLLVINTDGSIPKNYLGPRLTDRSCRGCPEYSCPGPVHLALAPDGKTVYLTGLVDSTTPDTLRTARPFHAVYRVRLDGAGPARPYLGVPDERGNDRRHFNDPRGLGTDSRGNLYVSDHGNNRIVVFGPDGGYLGQISIERPGPLCLHQRTNGIYVLSTADRPYPITGTKLRKLSAVIDASGNWVGGGGKEITAMDWPGYRWQVFAVDGNGAPTIIWIGASMGARTLLRMQERGGSFGRPVPVLGYDEPALTTGGLLAVNRRTDEVFTRSLGTSSGRPGARETGGWIRIDGRTGRSVRLRLPGADIAVGPGGFLYILEGNTIRRYDRQGKPVPFEATGGNAIDGRTWRPYPRGPIHGVRGHCVALNGDIYLMSYSPEARLGHTTVNVYGPDGKLKRRRLIWASGAAGGVKVDLKGNIYITDNVKPKGHLLPPELRDKIPASRQWKHGFNWYTWMYGSVVKFPPEGGAVRIPSSFHRPQWPPEWHPPGGGRPPKPVAYRTWFGRPKVYVQNALWVCPGISPAPALAGGCVCLVGRFDVDGFGRVFMPDVTCFRVRVVDANANAILSFGSYGNMDSQGPGSAVPVPEIPFAWPQYVAVSDRAVYISDVVNRRIVRVRLDYRISRSIPLK